RYFSDGCDLHARQQALAMLDTETGELVNLMLWHESNEVREFYSQLPAPSVGRYRSHRIDALVSESHGGVGNRMPSRPSRHDSRGGTPQAENRSARCGVDSADAGGKAPSGDLVAHEGTARSTGLGAASSSVGAHTNADPKRAAGHCLGQWLTTRSESVELRRAGQDRLLAV